MPISKIKTHMLQHKSRFKNYLIPSDELVEEAQHIKAALEELRRATQCHHLKQAEQVLLFVLIYLHQRKGVAWQMSSGVRAPEDGVVVGALLETLSSRFECLAPIKKTKYLLNIAVESRIRLLPQAIFDVLWKWGQGQYDLVLWEDVPTPLQMLEFQSQGKRIVTLNLDCAIRGGLVDGQRDAFEFLLHDLLHADLFFNDPQSHVQQRLFFTQLQEVIARENLLVHADDLFLKDLSYLMSDMNSHRAHLEAQFKATLIAFRLRRENRLPQAALSAEGLDWVHRVTI